MKTKLIVITGASSGLGKLIAAHIHQRAMGYRPEIINWDLQTGVDITDEASVHEAALRLGDKVDVLINNAGANYINWLGDTPVEEWDRLLGVNAKGIFLCSKHLAPKLGTDFITSKGELDTWRGGTILNIVSNAARVPMTHSIAYNASKGAAAIMTRQLARELIKTHGITVFSVSPNKLAGTAMSDYIGGRVCELREWTPEQAAEYQRQALPALQETDPEACAEFVAFLLSEKRRHIYLNGCDLQYGT